ncbi:MAG: transporter substrate-binding domain-containing protein [Planctomycetota bacterium]
MIAIACLLTSGAVGDELRIATREAPPFSMRGDDGTWRGISIDLLERVRQELGTETTVEFVELPLADMLEAVAAGDVDLAAAAITVNLEREERLDFSHPYFASGLGIALRIDDHTQGFWGFVRAILSPTFLRIVAGLIITMLIVGVAVYVCEYRENREQFGGGPFRGVLAGLWWSAVTLTTVGYDDKVPKSSAGRVIAAVWMFSGLFIIASFTAAITSALTLSELRSSIAGPNDLARVQTGTVRDSTSDKYLRRRRLPSRRYDDVEAALDALARNDCDAVVYDAAVLRYKVQLDHDDRLVVLPSEFERQDYAIAMPPNSELREPINQAILRIKADPDWELRLRQLLGDRAE